MLIYTIGDVIVIIMACIALIPLCILFLIAGAIRFFDWLRKGKKK